MRKRLQKLNKNQKIILTIAIAAFLLVFMLLCPTWFCIIAGLILAIWFFRWIIKPAEIKIKKK